MNSLGLLNNFKMAMLYHFVSLGDAVDLLGGYS